MDCNGEACLILSFIVDTVLMPVLCSLNFFRIPLFLKMHVPRKQKKKWVLFPVSKSATETAAAIIFGFSGVTVPQTRA